MPPAPLPHIGILADRYARGCEDPHRLDGLEPMHAATLQSAMETYWLSDAHFVAYGLAGPGAGPIPRMRKAALAPLRAAGAELVAHALIFDYDNPGHAPWDDTLWASFLESLGASFERAPWARDCMTWFYATANGARLIYVLAEPIPVDRAEQLHAGLVALLRVAGLALDPACSDWTHLFRLPRVVRDGVAVEPREEWSNPDARLDPAAIASALGPSWDQAPTASLAVAPLALEQPTQQRVRELLGGVDRPDWYRSAKRDLRFKNCWTTLFDYRTLAPDGARNSTIHSYVGEVVRVLHQYQRVNKYAVGPEHVYALFYQALDQLEKDEDHFATAWRAVCSYWAKEDARTEAREAEQAVSDIQTASILDTIIKSMRTWCDAPALHTHDERASAFASSKMIAATPAGKYVMTPRGYYDSRLVTASNLIPLIRELGMDSAIPLGYMTDNEKWKAYTAQNIIDRHATVVNEVEGVAAGNGNWIRGLGTGEATMILKLYARRTDIKAEYSRDVDEWLHYMGSGTPTGYDDLRLWFGHALAFDEGPTCGLALTGPPGFGKKMGVQALGETVQSQRVVDAQEGQGFQSALMRSPFFSVNEGFPQGHRGYSPVDFLRRMTGGDVMPAEKKYGNVIDLRVPFRVILTANNLDVVRVFAGQGRELSVDDRMAVAQRIMLIRVPMNAVNWLRSAGGPSFTRGWITGDGGQQSNYTIAKHFLWLYENRPPVPRGQRFMVMGNLPPRMLQSFNTQTGAAPVVLEAVAGLLERLSPDGAMSGGAVLLREQEQAEYWVTEHGVMSWIKDVMRTHSTDKVLPSQVGRVLRGILHPGSPEDGQRRAFTTARGAEEAKWYRVSIGDVVDEAVERGWPCAAAREVLTKNQAAMGRVIRMPSTDGSA